MAATSVFIVKESGGTYGLNGPPSFGPWDGLKKDLDEARFTSVSPNGNLVAVGNNSLVNIFNTQDGILKCTIRSRMLSATFSPNGAYLMEWNNPGQNTDNFKIWSISNGKDVKVVHSLKLSKPPDALFSADETIYARSSNNSIIFSQAPDFHGTHKKTPETMKIAKFSLSTGPGPIFVLCFIPSTSSGQPSFARMFRYPDFNNVVASRSFFQADRVEMKWNKRGTAVLLITSSDVDKSGQSYYGKTMLFYLDVKGETAVVQTEADCAIIHAAEWSPNSSEFAIISGKMPQTRASLMNSKCQVVFDMGISARNAIHFNPQGNLLILGGFGNLAHGKIEIWEMKKHKKLIATATATATTQLEWLNDGVHFVTATTAPRMQVGNEFRIWDYKGKEVHQWKAEKHLFGIIPFRSEPPPPFPEANLEIFVKSQGNKPLAAKIEEKKASVYIPPSKRGIIGGGVAPPAPSKGQANATKSTSVSSGAQSQLSENEKKIRAVKKKLEQIDKIKEMLKDGKKIEKNQEDKLQTEKELLNQLEDLRLS